MGVNVTFHKQHDNAPEIKQASIKRTWMDATYKKHAYHCQPLTLANISGWVIELQEQVVAYWDGTSMPEIRQGQATPIQPGIIGFGLGWVIQAPGYNVRYGSVPNWFDSQAHCLTALVDGQWPDAVQANWLLEPGKEITFKQSMPIVFITLENKQTLQNITYNVTHQWLDAEHQTARQQYQTNKKNKLKDNEWTGWTKGIKTLTGNIPKLPTIS